MSAQKKKKALDPASRQAEMEGARLFGKHVSRTKGRLLLAVTLVCCALPVGLGLRLWEEIPEIVETGLIGMDGRDDSLPRAAVVFALPGLMCVLDLLAHYQLMANQKRMTVPKAHVRLVGRWGFPIISVLFCGGMILQSAGRPGADWDAVHRFTGGVWLAAGLAAIAGTMEGASWVAAACGGLALIVPGVFIWRQG